MTSSMEDAPENEMPHAGMDSFDHMEAGAAIVRDATRALDAKRLVAQAVDFARDEAEAFGDDLAREELHLELRSRSSPGRCASRWPR